MTNYLDKIDYKLLAQDNELRSYNSDIVRLINEQVSYLTTSPKFNNLLTEPENSTRHYCFQRNSELVNHFLDVCRMIQLSSPQNGFTIEDIVDEYIYIMNHESGVELRAQFNTNGTSLKETLRKFVTYIINHVLSVHRDSLQPLLKPYFFDELYGLKEKSSIGMITFEDHKINGKITSLYKLTDKVMKYLLATTDAYRGLKGGINFEQLQSNLELEKMNPNDVLLQIRDSIQRLHLFTQKIEEIYKNYRKEISSQKLEDFYDLLDKWNEDAQKAEKVAKDNFNKMAEKIRRLKSETISTSIKNKTKIAEWHECKIEQRKYYTDLLMSCTKLSEMIRKLSEPKPFNIHQYNLRDINDIFNINTITHSDYLFNKIASIFVTKYSFNKEFNPEILFTLPQGTSPKKDNFDKVLAEGMISENEKRKLEEKEKIEKEKILNFIQQFMIVLDKEIEILSINKFRDLLFRKSFTPDDQRLSSLVQRESIKKIYQTNPQKVRQVLSVLSRDLTTLTYDFTNTQTLNTQTIGFNKETIEYCLKNMESKYYYIFISDNDRYIATPDEHKISDLIIGKVEQEKLKNEFRN